MTLLCFNRDGGVLWWKQCTSEFLSLQRYDVKGMKTEYIMSECWEGQRHNDFKRLFSGKKAAIWGKLRTKFSLHKGIEMKASLLQRGVHILSEEGGGVFSEGDMDGLFCNPLTCALFLTCTLEHCSADLSMAQKHAALLPTQPTLLCINSQRPNPHRL